MRRRELEMPECESYNLRLDPGEQKSVLKDHPNIVKRSEGLLQQARDDLGDSLTGIKPKNVRAPGHAE